VLTYFNSRARVLEQITKISISCLLESKTKCYNINAIVYNYCNILKIIRAKGSDV